MPSRVLFVAAGLALAVFGVAAALGLQPGHSFSADGPAAWVAAAGVGLLTIDALLPVPSSAIVTTLGARFGTLAGGLLSAAGLVAGAMLAFVAGRLAARANWRRGHAAPNTRPVFSAVVLTRGIPVLSEAVAFAAGATQVPVAHFSVAATAGALPVGFVGAAAGELIGLRAILVTAAVLLVGHLAHRIWRWGRAPESRRPRF